MEKQFAQFQPPTITLYNRSAMTSFPRIRLARPEEASGLSELCVRSKAVWGYDQGFMTLARIALEVDPEQIRLGEVWVATVADGSVAGLVALGPSEHPNTLDLDKLFVEPRWIRSGVGRALMTHAIDQARRRGAKRLTILADPPPVGELLRQGTVGKPLRTRVADGENAGPVRRNPGRSGGMGYALGRAVQCEYPTHGAPSATAHPDNDRRFQITDELAQVFVGASVDPDRPDSAIHRAFFDAENGVGQKHRRLPVELPRTGHVKARFGQQLAEIVVGLVVGVVAAAVADEIADIAKILADGEQLRPPMTEPRLPVADDVRVVIELGATADFTGAALDANPTGLPSRYERTVWIQLTSLVAPRSSPSSATDRKNTR